MTFLQSCYLKSINHDIKARKAYTLKNIVAKGQSWLKAGKVILLWTESAKMLKENVMLSRTRDIMKLQVVVKNN